MSTRFQLHASAFGFADIQHPCNVITITMSATPTARHEAYNILSICVDSYMQKVVYWVSGSAL